MYRIHFWGQVGGGREKNELWALTEKPFSPLWKWANRFGEGRRTWIAVVHHTFHKGAEEQYILFFYFILHLFLSEDWF